MIAPAYDALAGKAIDSVPKTYMASHANLAGKAAILFSTQSPNGNSTTAYACYLTQI